MGLPVTGCTCPLVFMLSLGHPATTREWFLDINHHSKTQGESTWPLYLWSIALLIKHNQKIVIHCNQCCFQLSAPWMMKLHWNISVIVVSFLNCVVKPEPDPTGLPSDKYKVHQTTNGPFLALLDNIPNLIFTRNKKICKLTMTSTHKNHTF